jgi:hypothetical protein
MARKPLFVLNTSLLLAARARAMQNSPRNARAPHQSKYDVAKFFTACEPHSFTLAHRARSVCVCVSECAACACRAAIDSPAEN